MMDGQVWQDFKISEVGHFLCREGIKGITFTSVSSCRKISLVLKGSTKRDGLQPLSKLPFIAYAVRE